MYLKKALKGSLSAFILTILAAVCWYLFRFILARNLTLAEYGLFFSVYSFLAFLALVVDFGFIYAVPKYLIDLKVKNKKKDTVSLLYFSVLFQFVLSVIILVLMLTFSGWLSKHYFHFDVSSYLWILGIWFISIPLSTFLIHIFSGFQKYTLNASIDFVKAATLAIISLVLISFGKSILAPIIAYAVINFVLFLIYAPFIKSNLAYLKGVKFSWNFKLYKSLIKYGLLVSISTVVWIVLTQTDTLLLTYFKGVEAVGLYQVAVPLASIALYLVNAILVVAYPMASELYAKKKYKELREGIKLFYKYIFVVSIPIILVLFSFSALIISFLFGDKYVGASPALQILAIGALFSSVTLFNNIILSAIGKPGTVAKVMGGAAGLNIVLCVILIPVLGIVGAAISTASTFFISLLISTVTLNKELKSGVPIFSWVKILFLGIITTAVIYYLKRIITYNNLIELAIIGLVAGIIYVGGCFLLRIVEIKELKYLLKNLK